MGRATSGQSGFYVVAYSHAPPLRQSCCLYGRLPNGTGRLDSLWESICLLLTRRE